jgi:hypothetical protein
MQQSPCYTNIIYVYVKQHITPFSILKDFNTLILNYGKHLNVKKGSILQKLNINLQFNDFELTADNLLGTKNIVVRHNHNKSILTLLSISYCKVTFV